MGSGKQDSFDGRFAAPAVQPASSSDGGPFTIRRSVLPPAVRKMSRLCYQGNMDEPPPFRQSSRKFARLQRQNMTRAETMLWGAARNHQIDGYGFRRQTPIGPYFADFVCLARKLIVEADGRTHKSAGGESRDAQRDAWFRREGFRVLRFPDDLVIGGLPIVVQRIRAALREP